MRFTLIIINPLHGHRCHAFFRSSANDCLKRAPKFVLPHSASIWLGAMELAVLVALLTTLQLYANTAASATEFNCYNTLVTDEWREAVLNRHNELRRRLSEGKQTGADDTFPKAGNINKLNWDCNMEMLIDEKIGGCDAITAVPANAAYGAAKEMYC
ncbi:hypothetical protein Aduo_000370 [Ancylostoma duodenale]